MSFLRNLWTPSHREPASKNAGYVNTAPPPGPEGVQLVACLDAGTSFSGYHSSMTTAELVTPGTYPHEPQGFNYCKQPSALLYKKLTRRPERASDYQFLGTGHCVDLQLDKVPAVERDSYVLIAHPKLVLAHPQPKHAVIPPGLAPEDIVTDWLRGLRESAMASFQEVWGNYPGYDPSAIYWMFTVPANCSDQSMAIMRTAAHKAGYTPERDSPLLSFCHEPEAAVVAVATELKLRPVKAGDHVMVLDAGGGTVDFALHEVAKDGDDKLSQLLACDAVSTGGSYLDLNFQRLARTQLGLSEEAWDKWKATYPRKFRVFMTNWEKAKRNFGKGGQQQEVAVDVDSSLAKLLSADKAQRVEAADDRLVLPGDLVKSQVFDPEVTKVVTKALQLLGRQGGADYIILAGGFSSSPYLRGVLQDRLGGHLSSGRVFAGENSGAAIMRGGVLLAKRPTLVVGRRSALAYGVQTRALWKNGMREDYKVYDEEKGKWRCHNYFDLLIRAQELVSTDHTVCKTYAPVTKTQSHVTFPVYTSPSNEVQYTTDPCVVLLGKVELELPAGWSDGLRSADDRDLRVTFTAGQAELQVTAEDVMSGKKVAANMVFIAN